MSRSFPRGFKLKSPAQTSTNQLVFSNNDGNTIKITILTPDIVRVQHSTPTSNPLNFNATVTGQTEPYSTPKFPPSSDILSLFPCPKFPITVELAGKATEFKINTTKLTITCKIQSDSGDLTIHWSDKDSKIAQDLAFRAYPFSAVGCGHFLERIPGEFYYGGEHPSPLALNDRRFIECLIRFRIEAADALGYDPQRTDPLYKVTPFNLTINSNQSLAYGIYYNTLCRSVLDFGCEIDAFVGSFRYFSTDDTSLDYFFMYGGIGKDCVGKVLELFTSVIGRPALAPKYSFGYLASAMGYAESESAQSQIQEFPAVCKRHEIPCDLIHLSSGYTVDERNGSRNVFKWNKSRFPNPKALFSQLIEQGIRVSANVKPWLLQVHPDYDSCASNGAFVKDRSNPSTVRLWSAGEGDSGDGSYFDFTSHSAQAYWTNGCKSLLNVGIVSLWNDNNEIAVTNDLDSVSLEIFKLHPTAIGRVGRPLQTLLMAVLSYNAMLNSSPTKRPFLISRSSCPGVHRFASQTWSGDNSTSWTTLKHNVPMGLGAGLALLPAGYGHDCGGFVGPRPSPELFVRWVQNAVLQPRFWQGVTEPWMYPEVLPIIRSAILFRYQIKEYLYTLGHVAHLRGHPIARPLFFHFPMDMQTYAIDFSYMLGPDLLVASVLEENTSQLQVYLPQNEFWWNYWDDGWVQGGKSVTVDTPLARIGSLFIRGGACVPFVGSNPDERIVLAYPPPADGVWESEMFVDDGESNNGKVCRIVLSLNVKNDKIYIGAKCEGDFKPEFDTVRFAFHESEKRMVEGSGIRVERKHDSRRCFGVGI